MTPLERVSSHLRELEIMAEADLCRVPTKRNLAAIATKIANLRIAVDAFRTASFVWHDPEPIAAQSLADHWHGAYASGVGASECDVCRLLIPTAAAES